MSRYPNIKKAAKKLQKYGRLGDTKLAHINPAEEKLLEQISGKKATINPKTGLKEFFPWIPLGMAAAGAGIAAIGSSIKNKKQKKAIKLQSDLEKEKLQAQIDALSAQAQIPASEKQAMASLRRASEEGTMDVQGLTQQMTAPIYQQGQQQQAQAMQQVTAQGLEGSIIAQEASRKVGADVRSSIADQARQIAMANEQTRAGAQQRLQGALFKRGDLMRSIAMRRAGLEGQFGTIDTQEQINQLMRQGQYGQEMLGHLGSFASQAGGLNYSSGTPGVDIAGLWADSGAAYTGPSLGTTSNINLLGGG